MPTISLLNKEIIKGFNGSITEPKETEIPSTSNSIWNKYFSSQEGKCDFAGANADCNPICAKDYKINQSSSFGTRVLYTCDSQSGTRCSVAKGKYCACAKSTPDNTVNWCPPMKTISGGIENGTVVKIDADFKTITTDCNEADEAERLDAGQIKKSVKKAPVSATCKYSNKEVLVTPADIIGSRHDISGSTKADPSILRNYCWRKKTTDGNVLPENSPNVIADPTSCSAILQKPNVSDATVNEYNTQIENWCEYKDVFGVQAETQLREAIDKNEDTIVLPSSFIFKNQIRKGDKLLIKGQTNETNEVVQVKKIIDRGKILPPPKPIEMEHQISENENPPFWWGNKDPNSPNILCLNRTKSSGPLLNCILGSSNGHYCKRFEKGLQIGMKSTAISSEAQRFCNENGGDLINFTEIEVDEFGGEKLDEFVNGAYCNWSTGLFGQNDHRKYFAACGPDEDKICFNAKGVLAEFNNEKVCENPVDRTQQVTVIRGQSLFPKPQWLTNIIGDDDELTGGSSEHSQFSSVFYISGRGKCECYDLFQDESTSGKQKRKALATLAQRLGGPLQCTALACALTGSSTDNPLVEAIKDNTINKDGNFLPCPQPTGCIAINNILGSDIGRDLEINNFINCGGGKDVCNELKTEESCSNSNPFEKDGKDFACEWEDTSDVCLQKSKCNVDKFKCKNGKSCDNQTGKCLDKCTLSDLECNNGGAISGVKPNCSCTCIKGFTGTTCQTPPDVTGNLMLFVRNNLPVTISIVVLVLLIMIIIIYLLFFL